MKQEEDIRYAKEGELAFLTLARPDARNAYSDALVRGLVEGLERADADPQVRCIILTGEGSAFCAGGDLKAMRDKSGMFAGGPTELRSRYARGIQSIPRAFERCETPVIAAVNGPAIGAGLDLACMADLRVAARRARFGSTFVRVGLVPGDGGAYFLARTIGFPRALELILSARIVDADEALAMGLVHRVVEGEELMAAARELAQSITRNAPVAVRLAKRAAYGSWGASMEEALELAATYQGIAQNTDDHVEAVSAMLEKRPPRFDGK